MAVTKDGINTKNRKLILIKETDKMYSLKDDKRVTKLYKGMEMINPSVTITFKSNIVIAIGHVYYEANHREIAVTRLRAKIIDKVNQYKVLYNDFDKIKNKCL